jgi:molybdopterin biosynthesis enzyme
VHGIAIKPGKPAILGFSEKSPSATPVPVVGVPVILFPALL